MAIGPIITSYILGGLIGKEIITRSDLSIWSCRFKGCLVAAGGLLSFFLINLIYICLRDYDNSGDFSPERSLNFAFGITGFMAPFALFFGGLAGETLKAYYNKYSKSV